MEILNNISNFQKFRQIKVSLEKSQMESELVTIVYPKSGFWKCLGEMGVKGKFSKMFSSNLPYLIIFQGGARTYRRHCDAKTLAKIEEKPWFNLPCL